MLGDHVDPVEAGSASTGYRCRPASGPLPVGLSGGSTARPPSRPQDATLPSSALGPSRHACLPRWLSTSTGRPRNYPSAFPHLAPRLAQAHLPPGSGKHSDWPGRLLLPLGTHWAVIPETAGPCSGHSCTRMHTHTHTCTRARAQAWLELRPPVGGARPPQGAESRALLPAAPGHPGQSGQEAAHCGVCRRAPPPTRGSWGSPWQLIERHTLY